MRAGPLRHRITLEQPVSARSGSGAVRDIYEPWLENIRGAIEDIRGNESWVAHQIAADVSTRIRIRYREGVTAKHRVRHDRLPGSPTGIDYYEIESVIRADGKKTELWLFCRKRDAEGFRTGQR
jgi:SPP1 family predicted phage head-tail adaptor